MSTHKDKFIFIDSNVYKGLYSSSEKFSNQIIDLFEKLVTKNKAVILLPQQVHDEVSKNRLGKWAKEELLRIDSKINNVNGKIKKIDLELSTPYISESTVDSLKKQIIKQVTRLEKEKPKISKRFLSNRSKANINYSKLYKMSIVVDEDRETQEAAFFRCEKRNPPSSNGGSKDTSDFVRLGDSLIWETLLKYFKDNKISKPKLLFVSEDKAAWEDTLQQGFHKWLEIEFKDCCGGKITFVSDLSKIPDLTQAEQNEIKEEEFRNTIDSKLKYANMFAVADSAMREILKMESVIDEDLIEKILLASSENNKHSGGPYNQVLHASKASSMLHRLLELSAERKYDMTMWSNFYNSLPDKLKSSFPELRRKMKRRGATNIINPLDEVDPEDITF